MKTSLRVMLRADDTGAVSQSPGGLRKTIGVIVVVCAAFGFAVSETKTEMMCLRTKGVSETTAVFSVANINEFVHLGGNANHNADLSTEVDRRIRNTWCSFREYTLVLYGRPRASFELKNRMLTAEVPRQRCAASSRGARARATTTRCAESTIGS